MSELTVGSIGGLAANNNVVTVPSGHIVKQPGGLIQVQQATLSTRQIFSSISGWTQITGFAVSITPKFSNSKIILTTTFPCSTSADTSTAFRWHRSVSGGSSGYLPYGTGYSTDYDAHFKQASYNAAYWQYTTTHELIDLPNTSSEITYSIHFRPYDSSRTFYFNGAADVSANADRAYCVATITAKEVMV
jgi:hypothetical protein